MKRRKTHAFAGYMLVVAVILGVGVFVTLAYEYRRTREDFIALATAEARVVLNTLIVTLQTTSGIRQHMYDAGVATDAVAAVMAPYSTRRLLQRLGLRWTFDYLACQDEQGVIASYGIADLSTIAADPFLQRAISAHMFDTRLLSGERFRLEAVQPFLADDHVYLLRACISLGSVQELEARRTRRQALLGGVVLCVTLLIITYVINIQNTRLLARERDAITVQVRHIQQQMSQQERITAVGRLAAGVAHEIRNPLNAVQILVQRLEREITATPDSTAKMTEFTRVIKEEIKRLNQIIEEFLRFARVQPPAFAPVDVCALVHDLCALELGETAERGLLLVTDCSGAPAPIAADPHQLKQALMNVIRNAIEATPAGGTISVTAGQADGWTTISVSDTGSGMSTTTRDRAFDLYFTTKERGVGIGLAITRRIIEAHHGDIALADNTPRGTTVHIRIPTMRRHENPGD
jgi:signal transduction histidine kinase